jgi:hypothetical protein
VFGVVVVHVVSSEGRPREDVLSVRVLYIYMCVCEIVHGKIEKKKTKILLICNFLEIDSLPMYKQSAPRICITN